jgi:HSP20 family protein
MPAHICRQGAPGYTPLGRLSDQERLTMDDQQQRGPQGPASSQQGAQMQQGQQGQQSGASTQQGSGQPQGAQQSQFSTNAGQQGGGQGAQPGGEPPHATRGSNRYTDFFSGRGGSPLELLKRLDEDVDRLFHQFIGGGRELLRNRLRERGGMDSPPGAGTASGAGSSGGVDEAMTEAPGGSAVSSTAMGSSPASGWLPEVEICERGGRLHVATDLPGLAREDLQLHFDSGQLVVQGERRTTSTTAQPGGYYRSERTYGQFRRVIPLPEGVNPDTAQASFHNGVLDVSFDMPVRHNRNRQIPIQDGSPGSASGIGGKAGAGSEVGPVD